MTELSVRCFSVQKAGNRPEENEDACEWSKQAGHFCLADGATESVFAGTWARLIAESFVESPPEIKGADQWLSWLGSVQDKWWSGINWDEVPWYAEEKVREGAYATLLGLQVEPVEPEGQSRVWHAVAVGDCCLFHIKDRALVASWPLESSLAFGHRPELIFSRRTHNRNLDSKLRFRDGTLDLRDLLILGTDAIAQWFLRQVELGQSPWETLSGVGTPEEFGRLVDVLRVAGELKNDDSTILMIQLE